MYKKIILVSTLTALVAAIAIILNRSDAGPETEFIRNKDRYALRFDRMNTVESETMVLEKDDELHVFWQIEKGQVDIRIAMEGAEAIYQGDGRSGGDNADFCVEILQTGSYIITVSARNAKGQIEFTKQEKE